MNRRRAMKIMLAGSAACLLPASAFARPRCCGRLSLFNIHTKEFVAVDYLRADGRFDRAACERLEHFFRCHYNGREHSIDPELFKVLDMIHTALGAEEPYELISGYRSPEYNRILTKRSNGVAKRSYHLRGKAADVCIPGVPMQTLRDTARRLGNGGVGIYSRFVHVDTGPRRSWGSL